MHAQHGKYPRSLRVLLFWLLFGAGVVVHFLAPNLEKKENAFVIPLASHAGKAASLSPDLIVAKERWMQSLSAVLTAAGALGLGFLYRGVLFRRTSPAGTTRSRDERGDDVAGGRVPETQNYIQTQPKTQPKGIT